MQGVVKGVLGVRPAPVRHRVSSLDESVDESGGLASTRMHRLCVRACRRPILGNTIHTDGTSVGQNKFSSVPGKILCRGTVPRAENSVSTCVPF